LYCGISTNVERRVIQHNAGKGSKYTRSRRPVEFLVKMEVENISDALKREREIKKLPKDRKMWYFIQHSTTNRVFLNF
jgi:putative endonuclease